MDNMPAPSPDVSFHGYRDSQSVVPLGLPQILVLQDVRLVIHDRSIHENFRQVAADTASTDIGRAGWRTGPFVVLGACHLMLGRGHSSVLSNLAHTDGFDLPLQMPNECRDVAVAARGRAHSPPINPRWNPHFLAMMVGGEFEKGGEEAGCATPHASNDVGALLLECGDGLKCSAAMQNRKGRRRLCSTVPNYRPRTRSILYQKIPDYLSQTMARDVHPCQKKSPRR